MLFCNVPFANTSSGDRGSARLSYNLAHVFDVLNQRKDRKVIESYSVTQTSLEQIFVQLAGEDEDALSDQKKDNKKRKIFIIDTLC